MKYASLCDGIGAAHAAWMPLGWRCAWTSEIEAFPIAVVEQRMPGLENLGDMTKITQEMLDARERPDLLVGGTPCQSFSVAGLRGGLDDPRGNLALRFMQLVGCLRPRWVVWENVPGVLSVDGGRAMGSILGALSELGYGWCYRVLDAQYFGVPQRRRRVFAVGHLGDWRRAAAVLLERPGVRRNPGAGAAARSGVARCLGASTGGASAKEQHYTFVGGDGTPLNPVSTWWDGGQLSQTLDAVLAKGQTMPEKNRFPAVLVAHTSDGIVADPITTAEGKTWTHKGNNFRLRNCVQQGVDLFNQTLTGDCHVPLRTAGGHGSPAVMEPRAVGFSDSAAATNRGIAYTEDGTPPLRGGQSGNAIPAVAQHMAVRRLTPLECERLQGFPDGWTAINYRNKPAADGPRYRALGNSMAVPVVRWIGERIAKVEAMP